MELFSSSQEKNHDGAKRPIPKDVFEAVSVMGKARQTNEVHPVRQESKPQGQSPFLGSDTFSPDTAPKKAFQKSPEGGYAEPAFPRAAAPEAKMAMFKNKKILLWAVASFLLVVIAALAAWYLLRKSAVETISVEQPAAQSEVTMMAASPSPEAISSAPFSADTTNFLSIDTETVTLQSWKQLLSQSGAEMMAANMTRPVEFLLTDKNNNPVAFSRFAYLMGLGLPEDLIAALGETFSIFLYNNGGKVTVGLSFVPTDMETVRTFLAKKEVALPVLFQDILWNDVTVPKSLAFRSGIYNTETVRYVNIDTVAGASFDYAIRGNEWLIGGSKETLRSIIDKKSQ